jgi:hypothetical protein
MSWSSAKDERDHLGGKASTHRPADLSVTQLIRGAAFGFLVAIEVSLWAVATLGVAIDVGYVWVVMRADPHKRPPSGVPVVGLFAYLLRIYVRPWDWASGRHRGWIVLLVMSAIAVVFHLTCLVFIPLRLSRRRHG